MKGKFQCSTPERALFESEKKIEKVVVLALGPEMPETSFLALRNWRKKLPHLHTEHHHHHHRNELFVRSLFTTLDEILVILKIVYRML